MSRIKTINQLGLLAVIVALTVARPVSAQRITSSPYSRYGFGELREATPTAYKGMGGVGIGMTSNKYINFANPAGYASTDSLSFLMDVGVRLNYAHYSDGNAKRNDLLGNLDYIAVQFPVYKNIVAVSLGIKPFTTAGYGISSNIDISNSDEGDLVRQDFAGSGSMQDLYFGFGTKIYKGLSFGANVAYNFGMITHSIYTYPSRTNMQRTLTTHSVRANGVKVDLGLHYTAKLNKENELTVGTTFSPAIKHRPEVTMLDDRNYGSTLKPDVTTNTVTYETQQPMQVGLGLSWNRANKLLLAGDIKYTRWGSVPNIFEKDGVLLKDSYKAALGFSYTKDIYSRNYSDVMTYRAGLSYRSSYLDIDPVGKLDRLGVSLGLGLPITVNDERYSVVNLSLEYLKALPANKGVYNEDQLVLSMSINFNETWFRKLKIY